jgi:hypothetical protein
MIQGKELGGYYLLFLLIIPGFLGAYRTLCCDLPQEGGHGPNKDTNEPYSTHY